MISSDGDKQVQGFLGEQKGGGVLRTLRMGRGTLSREYLQVARTVLDDLVANPELILQLPLERKPGGYTRNLLAGDDEVSIWAIVWSPGSATPIHDHHCSCCFGVVSGSITETWYRSIGEAKAVPGDTFARDAGYVGCMLPSGPNIHRMENQQGSEAISIHIYGFDHEAHASSIQTEFVASNG